MPSKEIRFVTTKHEEGEKRDFLPPFIEHLEKTGWSVWLDCAYGEKIGSNREDYESVGASFLHPGEYGNAATVMALRYPSDEFVDQLPTGTLLISMLHFPTREGRVQMLNDRGIKAIALDQIKDDDGVRLVENLRSVAWNGINAGFTALSQQASGLRSVNVLVMGCGNIGKHSVDAAIHFGNTNVFPSDTPVAVTTIGRTSTNDKLSLLQALSKADILVDATERKDASKPIIKNRDLAYLPDHAVIVDLCVDPYEVNNGLVQSTKGIEGIPQGNLDRFIIKPGDPEWDQVPGEIASSIKRTVCSCYSWPGVFPIESMRTYAKQLKPIMEVLGRTGYDGLSLNGDYYERAVYRGTLKYYNETNLVIKSPNLVFQSAA